MKKKKRRLLRNESGEATYISSVIYILVVVIMIVFAINVFHVITVKQEMDYLADELIKQIQLSGGVNDDTDALFTFMANDIEEVDHFSYEVTSSGDIHAIQIGTPFYVTVHGRCYLGGMWNLNLVPIDIVSEGSGVSEHYWK